MYDAHSFTIDGTFDLCGRHSWFRYFPKVKIGDAREFVQIESKPKDEKVFELLEEFSQVFMEHKGLAPTWTYYYQFFFKNGT